MSKINQIISEEIQHHLKESIGDVNSYDFSSGDCDLYAVALHRLYNYPLYVVRNYYPNDEYEPEDEDYELYGIDTEEAHIVVKLPNGNYLDSSGEMSEKELIDSCAFGNEIGEIKIEEIDENEALSIFGGCNKNDINKIMNHIKK